MPSLTNSPSLVRKDSTTSLHGAFGTIPPPAASSDLTNDTSLSLRRFSIAFRMLTCMSLLKWNDVKMNLLHACLPLKKKDALEARIEHNRYRLCCLEACNIIHLCKVKYFLSQSSKHFNFLQQFRDPTAFSLSGLDSQLHRLRKADVLLKKGWGCSFECRICETLKLPWVVPF